MTRRPHHLRWMAGVVAWSIVWGPVAAASGGRTTRLGSAAWADEPASVQVAQVMPVPEPIGSGTQFISLDFQEADLQTVLRALAQKAKVNIVTAKGVTGTITIRLDEVLWETALETILDSVDLAYDRDGNVITVMTREDLMRKHEMERELTAQEPLIARVIILKHLDAGDVKEFLQPQLSPQGRISVLEVTGQRGWTFGIAAGKKKEKPRQRTERDRKSVV